MKRVLAVVVCLISPIIGAAVVAILGRWVSFLVTFFGGVSQNDAGPMVGAFAFIGSLAFATWTIMWTFDNWNNLK